MFKATLPLTLLAAILAAAPASAASPDACSITVAANLEMTIPIVTVGGAGYRATLSQHAVSGSPYLWWTLSAAAPVASSAAFAACVQPDVYAVGQGMYSISSANVFYNGQRYQGDFMLSADAQGTYWLQLMSATAKP